VAFSGSSTLQKVEDHWNQGSISPTYVYVKLLCEQIPKEQRRQSSYQCRFALLGSACVKGSSKMLVKLPPREGGGVTGGTKGKNLLKYSKKKDSIVFFATIVFGKKNVRSRHKETLLALLYISVCHICTSLFVLIRFHQYCYFEENLFF